MTRTDQAPKRATRDSLSEREAALLALLGEHRLLIVPQLALLLGVSERTAVQRLKLLDQQRLLQLRPVFDRLPWAASITGRGLRALGSSMRAPQLNLNEYRHDVGVAWLWLAARSGRFGALSSLTSDRRMRVVDAAAVARGERPRWGVGLGLLGPYGRPLHHYPDLMLELASGHRVAVELELTAKSSRRMGRIMTAYASDARVDHVLYLVETRSIANRVLAAAEHAGIPERVHVQLLASDGIEGAELGLERGRAGSRQRERGPAVPRQPGSGAGATRPHGRVASAATGAER